MLSSSILSRAAASNFKNRNIPSNQRSFVPNALEPSSGDSGRIVSEIRPGKINVDFEQQAPRPPISATPLFNPQSQVAIDRPETQKALEKQAFQEAIKTYKEKADEIRATAENTADRVDSSDRESQDLLQTMRENNKVNNLNLITYRRSTAHSQHGSQFSSHPSSAESEGANTSRVALYNQAITAYITQDLYFSGISNIGLMTTV